MQSLFGESGIVKNKKMGLHFDDVLVHDVCLSSRHNSGYPFTKDVEIGIGHVSI
jgi:hypothetical protein